MFLKGLMAALAVSAVVMPATSWAWGKQGHVIVAAIADVHLNDQARQAVNNILAAEPGDTLESIASWADQHRTAATARWHFTNYPRGHCHFSEALECRGGECLPDAVNAQAAILGNRSLPTAERLQALKYVVHLAGGDSSQPLHNVRFDDGGNDYRVSFDGRETNLHRVWDSGLLRADATPKTGMAWLEGHGRPDYRALIVKMVNTSMGARGSSQINPVQWTEEACEIASRPGMFPTDHQVGKAYEAQWTPVMEHQLIRGGMHLAALLNQLLGPSEPNE